MFFLFMIIGVFVLSFVDAALGFGTSERWAEQGSWGGAAGIHNSGGLLTILFVLAIIIPYLAVAVRWLNDNTCSVWWTLQTHIPWNGRIISLYFLVVVWRGGTTSF